MDFQDDCRIFPMTEAERLAAPIGEPDTDWKCKYLRQTGNHSSTGKLESKMLVSRHVAGESLFLVTVTTEE
jgi:hypothetical protein